MLDFTVRAISACAENAHGQLHHLRFA